AMQTCRVDLIRSRRRRSVSSGVAVLDHLAAVQMNIIQKLFESAFMLIVAMFDISAVTLVIFSIGELWGAIRPAGEVAMQSRFVAVLECISLLTIAVAALELGQTILEEEVQRSSSISAPTR